MSDMIQLGVSSDSSQFASAMAEDRSALKATESAFQKFGDVVMSAMSLAADVSVAALQEIGGGLRTLTNGALNAFGSELGAIGAKVLATGAAVGAASSYFGGLWTTMRAGLAVAGFFQPWLRAISLSLTVATAATWAYGHSNESVQATLRGVGSDLRAIGSAVASTVADYSGATAALNAINSAAKAAINQVAVEAQNWANGIRIITDATLDWADSGHVSAASLRAQTAASEALIAKQQSQVSLFDNLKAIQQGAAAQAAHNAEIQRIGGLDSVDAINAEILALQQKAAAAILAGDATEESQKKTAALFAALEGQKGKVADNAKAKALQEQLSAEKAIADAKEKQRQLDESAADQITKLKDQIDLVTGAASKADIAMREAMRSGLTEDQAKEIARLTENLEKAQELEKEVADPKEAKVAATKSDKAILKSAFSGSQEANSIALRGVGGGSSIESIATKQLDIAKQQLIATKANKPPALQPLNI